MGNKNDYDILLIGAGPANIMAVNELINSNLNIKIAIIDKGRSSFERACKANNKTGCLNCFACDLIHGFGGAGMFSDGKIKRNRLNFADQMVKQVFDFFERFGLPQFSNQERYEKALKTMQLKIEKAGLDFMGYLSQHIGTSKIIEITRNIEAFFRKSNKVTFFFRTNVIKVSAGTDSYSVTISGPDGNQEQFSCRHLVYGTGKSGIMDFCQNLKGFEFFSGKRLPAIGVRYEFDSQLLTEITDDIIKDPAVFKNSPGIMVRNFCTCLDGEVVPYNIGDHLLLGGQSNIKNDVRGISNFAILVHDIDEKDQKVDFSQELFHQYIKKVRQVGKNRPLIQTCRDYFNDSIDDKNLNHPTSINYYQYSNLNQLIPGKVNLLLKDYLLQLSKINKAFISHKNIISAPAVEYVIPKIKLKPDFESNYQNLYLSGMISGNAYGIIDSAMTGLVIGAAIKNKMQN